MNIALKGHFLREGLRLNGHTVHELVIRKGETLRDALKAAPEPVDLVIWELFGAASDIQAVTPCEQPLVAYCIDTPLNAFWLKPCVKNFDAVFVDQPQCVEDSPAWRPTSPGCPCPRKAPISSRRARKSMTSPLSAPPMRSGSSGTIS